jgi:hypothetical protein
MPLLVLLVVLQAGCLVESDLGEGEGECGPRDLTPECCLKKNPGQWERCTGSPEAAEAMGMAPSLALRTAAAATAAAVAMQAVRIGSAERRGVELAVDLRTRVEKALVRCAREAEQEVNDYHFNGRSPSWEICQRIKVGERTTWAVYLGLFKHEQAWPCLREALEKLLPGKNYRLRPRFYVNPKTGRWEHMDEELMSQIIAKEGWSGLKGTIEPDIVLLDENGIVIHVYDLKFPCPKSNDAGWAWHKEGPWRDRSQGDVYREAFGVKPRLISPRQGLVPELK